MTTIGSLNLDGVNAAASAAPAPGTGQMTRQLREALPADRKGWWWGTGRRKTAVARARIKPSKSEGKISIMSAEGRKPKAINEYFSELRDQNAVNEPLKVTNLSGKFDIMITCHGGGYMGQAGACKLAIARALRDYDPTTEEALRDAGLLTRDSREVERKKYGQAGARRRFQFSKR
ncbi:MAG: 30S ribosomal protein S9 [Planctomycetota bacterium]|nr:30S ribosomal protein S9 [Planctomycetota bacterium]